MKDITLSVAIATFNEEQNIGKCISSIKDIADEIVVVDGFSTDRTRQVAEGLGARIIKATNKPIFHINKNIAISACRGKWILQLDADEVVTKELGNEIMRLANKPITSGDYVGYWLKRRNYFLGRFLKKGGQYPDPVIRLFQKGKGRLPAEDVHEQMKINGSVGWLKNDLLHFGTPNFERYFLRERRYASLEAGFIKARHEFFLFALIKYVFYLPIFTFLSIFFRHKGFIDGWRGFIFAALSSFHFIWAYYLFIRSSLKR